MYVLDEISYISFYKYLNTGEYQEIVVEEFTVSQIMTFCVGGMNFQKLVGFKPLEPHPSNFTQCPLDMYVLDGNNYTSSHKYWNM